MTSVFQPHRVVVRTVNNRGQSKDPECTILIGKGRFLSLITWLIICQTCWNQMRTINNYICANLWLVSFTFCSILIYGTLCTYQYFPPGESSGVVVREFEWLFMPQGFWSQIDAWEWGCWFNLAQGWGCLNMGKFHSPSGLNAILQGT